VKVKTIELCPDPNDPFSPDWQRLGGGSKIVHGRHAGIPVDLYLATPDTWWTLVVIRTGSKEHNIKLCRQAKRLGMKLHADGTGLDLDDPREYHLYQPTSEEGLFAKLQLPYVEPKDRR
jgi:DNA polymerase/3'-5' exonuclease PolX